jgi:hypothetical protein
MAEAEEVARESLHDRVQQFERMKLPGQMPMMHMGTAYLVSDLWTEVTRLSARCEALEKALEPFARVAEHDIGTDEDDSDIFRMMSANNRAPLLTVGDLRRARALTEGNKP